jgi:peptidoglycan hydrolase-like protein with peptidoglycan-binding domain
LVFKTICVAAAVCSLVGAAATTNSDAAKKKTAKRPVVPTAAATKAPAKAGTKTVAVKPPGTVATRSKTAKSSVTPKRSVRSSQQAPTPERYREIQQALIGKGYLQGEPTGEWGPDSVDALRRFQTDQNLTADGKIGSLSLIALGLGPKRLTAQTAPQPPAPEPPR